MTREPGESNEWNAEQLRGSTEHGNEGRKQDKRQ